MKIGIAEINNMPSWPLTFEHRCITGPDESHEKSLDSAQKNQDPDSQILNAPEFGKAFCFFVPNDLAAIRPRVREGLHFLRCQGVAAEDLAACELALVEACNNAVLYSSDRNSPVRVELICHPNLVELQVIDHTPGFDWPARITLPGPEIEGGRGLFLIKSMMHEALYLRSPKENRLCLRRERKRGSAPRKAPGASLAEADQEVVTHQFLTSTTGELFQQVMISRHQQEEMDRRLFAHELEIARKIQQSLLPKTFPVLPGFSVSGFCLSARQVGGDFYDAIELLDGCALLAVADVMGKGVPAALFAATLRTLLRTATAFTQNPARLLARINHLMYDELTAVDMFITAQLVVADTRKGLLRVASAGHNPLLYVTPDGKSRSAAPEGMPLGVLRDVPFREETLPLADIRTALLFTDGLTEARDVSGQMFGQERLADWLMESRNTLQSASQFAETFLKELAHFQGAALPRDDQTLLLLAQEPESRREREASAGMVGAL